VRRAAALLTLVALVAGCGGSGRANEILSDTASNLGKIHSGDLTLRLVVSPREGTKGRIGFELRGPFALRPGALPIAKIAYTQIAGANQATATFISTGTKAYAEVNGKAYELPPQSTELVRQAASGIGGSGGLGQFQIDSWVEDPVATDGGDVGGTRTDRVSAGLDVVDAANGLLGLVRQLGRDAPRIEGGQAKRLEDAVDSSGFEVWSGREDHLLRRLLLKADLGFDVPESLRRVLGDVVGAKIEFELAISNPNEPVSVPPPTNPLPSSELPSGGG
jgi:hypothetical protein